MMTTNTTEPTQTRTSNVPWRAIGCALLAATARLGVVVAAAAVLLILLLNEIAATLVYTLAAVLALMFSTCSFVH